MSPALTCPECAAPFAVDQRYCTECGRRVRPLPHHVAWTLATMAGARRIGRDRLTSAVAEAGGAANATGGSPLTLFGQPLELPSPRTMAVAVMALLAFGVIAGTSSFSLASSPLLVTVNRPAATAATTAAASAPPARSSPSTSSAPAAGAGALASAPSAPTGSGSTPDGSVPASSSASSTSSSSSSTSSSTGTTTSSTTTNGLPPIKHVWIIQLGDQGYANTFDGTSSDTYLNKTLASEGEVVPNVYASATSDLANEIGLVTGQGPTVQTENDCPTYTAVAPGTVGTDGQVSGDGCVYPYSTTSFESELSTAGMSWKAYVQGQGILPATSCIHPELAAADSHFAPTSTTGYATWRNPMVYLTDVTEGGCTYQDTGLAKLRSDLAEPATTPDVSFIYADPCDDGSDAPCLPGAASGTAQSDAFLKSVVPEIMNSAAYKADGMILITFAQAPQTGADADHSSCCDEPAQFPDLPSADYEPSPTTTGTTTTGTTTAGTESTGTDTTGTDTTGTGTETGTSSGTGTTGTTTSPAPFNPATITGPIITIPGVSATVGTTTSPQGLITGTDTSPTATTGTTTIPCPTTTTGTGTTTTGTATTGTGTTGTGTTGTGTTGTGTTGTGTTGTTTTGTATTETMGTGTGTGSTGTSTTPGCPTTGASSSASPMGGGGQVGMLVLSRYVTPNSPDGIDFFSTYSITASLEQLFGLKPTGYANTPGLPVFSSFLYSAYNSG